MTKKEAYEQMSHLVSEAEDFIFAAKKLANEHGLSFELSLGYGMGGEYLGEMSEKDGLVVYKLNFSIDTVIHRPPLREVNITAVTDKTIDYIAGTVAH